MKYSPIKTVLAACAAGVTVMAPAAMLANQPATAAAPGAPDKSCTGMVLAADPQERVFRVQAWWLLPSREFSAGDNCAYVMPGQKTAGFNELRPGEKITVSYRDANGVLVADRIEQQPMQYEGMVKAIDLAKRTLILHRSGFDKMLQIAGDCPVALRGGRAGSLADIQVGNHVTVTYETPHHAPTAMRIEQSSITFSGTLTALDLNNRTVKAKAGFETKAFHLGDNCAIVVNGKPNGRLDDLKPDEELDFSYDDINGVNVVDRIAPAQRSPASAYVTAPIPAY